MASEAVDFYLSIFPDTEQLGVAHYPEQDLPDFQADFAGEPLEIRFRIGNLELSAVNAGNEFTPNAAINFQINFNPDTDPDAATHLDKAWEGLLDGGEVITERGPQFFAADHGWVRDRYGVHWQLLLANPGQPVRPFAVTQLLFPAGEAQASKAIDFYTSVFPDSQVGPQMEYPAEMPHEPGALMFSEFHLAGQLFTAMDTAPDHPVHDVFNEGVSLIAYCRDQAEIDRFWAKLSTVPEAEQCGWCKDQFGVSWQVVPGNLDELMAAPGAYQAMMGMKKIVIADFEALNK